MCYADKKGSIMNTGAAGETAVVLQTGCPGSIPVCGFGRILQDRKSKSRLFPGARDRCYKIDR